MATKTPPKKAAAPGLSVVADLRTGALTIADGKTNDGWHGLQFFITSAGKSLSPATLASNRKGGYRAELAPGIELTLSAGPSVTGKAIQLTPTIANRSAKPFTFTGYGFGIADGAVGPQLHHPGLPVFAHSENLRYENLPHSRETFPFIRPLPESQRVYGQQGLGPMPVMILGKSIKDRWLVEGAATQDRHASSWSITLPAAPGRMLEYRSEYFWNGCAEEHIPAGESVTLESTLYLIVDAAPDQFYARYLDELGEIYGDRFAGPHSKLAEQPVFCTWNYGVYTGITEKDCTKRAAIAGKAQKGGIFQLDHGYQPPHGQHLSWGYMDAYYPDTAHTWDKTRFPGGPKKFVEDCKKNGLTPAIWWTPRMDIGGPISQDHPEWIAQNADGKPIENVGDLHPDYSVPEVRDFVAKTLRTVIHEWGIEGIKLDFFSWAFDGPGLVFRNGGTSVYWKRWLLGMIRKELGPTGYFLHCVSCPLGNPFLAIDGCDSYRAGGDIDHGAWENNVYNCSWILASFPAIGKKTWFADMDSFMGDMKYPVNERRFRGAIGYLTGGMIDISGKTETFDATALKEYTLLSERCDQGTEVRVLDRTAFFGRPLPRVLARPHTRSSKTRKKFGIIATVGLFNWENAAQSIAMSLSEIGIERANVKLREFWTGKDVPAKSDMLSATLEPRQHLLVDIYAK